MADKSAANTSTGTIAAGPCSLGSQCRAPTCSRQERYKCRLCKSGLHAQCGKPVDDEGAIECPDDAGCKAAQGAKGPPAQSVAGGKKKPAAAKAKAKSTASAKPVASNKKHIRLGSVRYEVPRIKGDEFVPAELLSRWIDSPHPSRKDQVVSPFFAGHKKESVWWLAYSQLDMGIPINQGMENNVACNLCGDLISVGKTASPTMLKKHIFRNHRAVYQILDAARVAGLEEREKEKVAAKPKHSGIFAATGKAKGAAAGHQSPIRGYAVNRLSSKDARSKCLRATARAIVANNFPQVCIRNDEFRRMQRTFAESASKAPKSLGIEALQEDITRMKGEITGTLKEQMKGHAVFGTTDHWTSRDGRAWEGNSFQWIDKFKIFHADLECKEYKGSTKSKNLAENYVNSIADWDISLGRRRYAVKPDETVMGQCVSDTEAKMNRFGQILEHEHGTDHSYCTDHNLQSTAVKPYSHKFFAGEEDTAAEEEVITNVDGSTQKVGKGILAKCRKLVSLIDSSPQKRQDMHAAQILLRSRDVDPVEKYAESDPLNVIQDVVVRWWSTYDMAERLLFLREAFDYMDQAGKLRGAKDKKSDPSRNLTEDEWEVLENLALLLAPWKEALKALESNSYVSSSLVLFLLILLRRRVGPFHQGTAYHD